VKLYNRELVCDECAALLEDIEKIVLPVATEEDLAAPLPRGGVRCARCQKDLTHEKKLKLYNREPVCEKCATLLEDIEKVVLPALPSVSSGPLGCLCDVIVLVGGYIIFIIWKQTIGVGLTTCLAILIWVFFRWCNRRSLRKSGRMSCPQCGAKLESPLSLAELDKCAICGYECPVPSPKPPKRRASTIATVASMLAGAALAVIINLALAVVITLAMTSGPGPSAAPSKDTPALPSPAQSRLSQPHPTTGELGKAWAAMDKKDWSTAAKILTALREQERDNPDVWFSSGELHFKLGNFETAIEHYKAAIALKPDFAQAYCGMGIAYANQKRVSEAIEAYKKAITADTSCGQAYILMGYTYSAQGRHAEAIAVCKQAIAANPHNAEAYLCMGSAFLQSNRYAEAIEAYKQAVAATPGNPTNSMAYFGMGSAFLQLNRYTEGIEAFKKAAAIDPNCGGLITTMAIACILEAGQESAKGRHAEAIEGCKLAVALDPNDAQAYIIMGKSYSALERYPEAVATYEQFLRLEPTGSQADDVRKKLPELRRLAGK
jgi:tetratricopeptide (TPR) repeat protein